MSKRSKFVVAALVCFSAWVLGAVAADAQLRLPKIPTLPPPPAQNSPKKSQFQPRPQPKVQPPPKFQPQPQPQPQPRPSVRAEDILRSLLPQQGQPEDARNAPSSVRTEAAPPRQPLKKITPQYWHTMAVDEQGNVICVTTKRLSDDLDGVTTGEQWKEHLQIAELEQQFATPPSDWPDTEQRRELAELADIFDKVGADERYAAIANLAAFQILQVALREYSREPLDQARRQLAASQSTLVDSLGNISTGAGWIKHLRLRELEQLLGSDFRVAPSANQPDSSEPPTLAS